MKQFENVTVSPNEFLLLAVYNSTRPLSLTNLRLQYLLLKEIFLQKHVFVILKPVGKRRRRTKENIKEVGVIRTRYIDGKYEENMGIE